MTEPKPKIAKQVFISYVREDKDLVLPYHDYLKDNGINTWMDIKKIKPGQDWKYLTETEFEKSALIVVFFSHYAHTKTGEFQSELKRAIKKLEKLPVGETCVIPVRLSDDTERHRDFAHLQEINASDPDSKVQLLNGINELIKESDAPFPIKESSPSFQRINPQFDISYKIETVKKPCANINNGDNDSTCDFSGDKLFLRSDSIKEISDISDILNSNIVERKLWFRKSSYQYNSPSNFHHGSEYNFHLSEIKTNGAILSVIYSWGSYFAGAAHGMRGLECFNFTLSPIMRIESIQELFVNTEGRFDTVGGNVLNKLLGRDYSSDGGAFPLIREYIIQQLKQAADGDFLTEPFENGASAWDDFDTFYFDSDGLHVWFQLYQVGPYSAGMPEVIIPYNLIDDLLCADFSKLLSEKRF
ncbi:MAG: TIR domain-containing protein [Candidatus Adiutrix sp.]|jgi:hypothetical protein|nr:TIR domain-containing protein [Candidatus Adiutrix sp.]